MEQKIGIGYDVHRLQAGRDLILGGVKFPFPKGLAGHSDADVLVHALMDALLGAASLGDIGLFFPDTDPAYKGISSLKLLGKVKSLLDEQSWKISNVDMVLIAEQPKIKAKTGDMKKNIAKALETSEETINIKATTTEGLGFTGRGEGMAAQAVCLLYR